MRRGQTVFPEHLARVLIVSAKFSIGRRTSKNQSASCDDNTPSRRDAAGIFPRVTERGYSAIRYLPENLSCIQIESCELRPWRSEQLQTGDAVGRCTSLHEVIGSAVLHKAIRPICARRRRSGTPTSTTSDATTATSGSLSPGNRRHRGFVRRGLRARRPHRPRLQVLVLEHPRQQRRRDLRDPPPPPLPPPAPGVVIRKSVGSSLEEMYIVPFSGSTAELPQFAPPLWPGIWIEPLMLGGVNSPSLREPRS